MAKKLTLYCEQGLQTVHCGIVGDVTALRCSDWLVSHIQTSCL